MQPLLLYIWYQTDTNTLLPYRDIDGGHRTCLDALLINVHVSLLVSSTLPNTACAWYIVHARIICSPCTLYKFIYESAGSILIPVRCEGSENDH